MSDTWFVEGAGLAESPFAEAESPFAEAESPLAGEVEAAAEGWPAETVGLPPSWPEDVEMEGRLDAGRSQALDRLTSPFLTEQMVGVPLEHVLPEPKAKPPPATAALAKLQFVDTRGHPVANRPWTLHQGRNTIGGKLDADGVTAPLGTADLPFDRTQPFRVHVPGVVLCIAKDAALVTNDPEVEYGGSLVDWRRAADADSRVRDGFWSEYEEARRSDQGPGAVHFLAHDHIVRRPVRLLGARAVFEARSLGVHVGPVVRYTDDHQALIWLELKSPMLVRVVYGRAPNQSRRPNEKDAPANTTARHACSVRIGGRHYAMVVLDGLDADTTVQYRIEFGNQPPTGALPAQEAEFTEAIFPRYVNPDRTLVSAAFNESSWFFLRTLPRQSDGVRFAHGSCRKWPQNHGEGIEPGPDALEAFGDRWLPQQGWATWPRFFVHTGDQIYADDLDHALATRLAQQRRAAVLPGPAPKAARDVAFGAWAGRFGWRYASKEPGPPDDFELLQKLRPRVADPDRERHDIAEAIARAKKAKDQQDAPTGALQLVKPQPTGSKLRVLNRLLWEVPVNPKDAPRIDKNRRLLAGPTYRLAGSPTRQFDIAYPSAGESYALHAADFAEYAAMYEQAWSTPGTRRALAHVPSYMIFDDHEVTDDWNADREWLDTIHSKRDPLAMWPMTVTDALVAYWVYQGWGNLSPQQAATDPRAKIIMDAQRRGRDALPELRRLVHQRAVLPSAPGGDRSQRLQWYFSVPTGGPPFLVVDLRTDRDARGKGGMSQQRLQWLERELLATRSAAAFVVLPVPFLMPDPMLFVFRHPRFTAWIAGAKSTTALKRGSDIEHPAGDETWDQIKVLLQRLQRESSTLKTLVIVSGDIHFSCNLDGQLPGVKKGPRLLQLVSSGLRQRISDAKQNQMASAYRGWLNTIGGSEGVDRHRGMVITLGGLSGPGGKKDNFVYTPSFAMVDMKTVPQATTRVPLIVQQQVTLDKDHALAAWAMRHMTQADGSAIMTLHDPGFKHPSMPSAYPHETGGIGVVKEDTLDEAQAEPLFGMEHRTDEIDGAFEMIDLEVDTAESNLEADEAERHDDEASDEFPLPFGELEAIDTSEMVELEEEGASEEEPATEDEAPSWDDRSSAT